MAKRTRSGRPPQTQHKAKSTHSRHDKRQRLSTPNSLCQSTDSAAVPLVGGIPGLVVAMSRLLDNRIAFRLPIVMAGAVLAGGRRTASSWFRCAGVKDDGDRFYDLLASIGKTTASVMLPMLQFILLRFDPGDGECWNLCGWLTAMVELECWDRSGEQFVDRSDRPWDNPSRRPSHADRRRQIAREMLRNEFFAGLHDDPNHAKIRERFERLMALAA